MSGIHLILVLSVFYTTTLPTLTCQSVAVRRRANQIHSPISKLKEFIQIAQSITVISFVAKQKQTIISPAG